MQLASLLKIDMSEQITSRDNSCIDIKIDKKNNTINQESMTNILDSKNQAF